MIVIQLPNTTPYFFGSGMAWKLKGNSLPEIIDTPMNDICICDFIQCKYSEKVFAFGGGEWWKNDKSEFLFKRLVGTDTIDIELWKDGVKVDDLNDGSNGIFYNGFASGSSEQQLYVGYLVEWEKVLLLHGVGEYQIKANLNIVGSATTYESRLFNLCVYSDIAAHQTVRFESYQDGNIIGGQFDFTGLNWYQSMRLPGTFGNPTPIYENTRYTTSNPQRKIRQIKDKMSTEYFLKTKKIGWETVQSLIYNGMLANELLFTDYNIKAETIFRRIGVFPAEIEKPEISGTPDKIYNIKFTTNTDTLQKRNY